MHIALSGNAQKVHVYRWARRLRAEGLKVSVCSDKPPLETQDYSGISVYSPQWSFMDKARYFWLSKDTLANNRHKARAWRSTIEELNPDIVHAHEALNYGPMLSDFPEYIRILTPWGSDMQNLRREKTEKASLVRKSVQSADVITSNAPGMEKPWSAWSGEPLEKFKLFSWGIDTNVFHLKGEESSSSIRTDLGIPEHRSLILSPRSANPNYQPELIIKGYQEMLRSSHAKPEDAPLLIFLRGGTSDQSWSRLRSLIAPDGSNFIYLVEKKLTELQMAELYRECDLSVMVPDADLLSMSYLESVASGCLTIVPKLPCYQSECCSLEEIREGKTVACILDETSPQMIGKALLYCNELTLQERETVKAHNAREISERHDSVEGTKRMVKTYEYLLNKKSA